MTEPEILEPETKLSDGAPPCWPPLAHIVDKVSPSAPVVKGMRALCGAKIMGIDLDGVAVREVCKKCEEITRRG